MFPCVSNFCNVYLKFEQTLRASRKNESKEKFKSNWEQNAEPKVECRYFWKIKGSARKGWKKKTGCNNERKQRGKYLRLWVKNASQCTTVQ